MKKVVITGGVGSGKSKVLKYLKDNCNCKIIRADDIAKKLMMPGEKCYFDIIKAFPDKVLVTEEVEADLSSKEDVTQGDNKSKYPPFDKKKLSELVFASDQGRRIVNSIVHPAVKKYVLEDVTSEDKKGAYDYYFFEVALAIEEGYDKLFDETWFIYASRSTRCERLKRTRGYSEERIDEIMSSQLSDEEYKAHCTHTINNDGNIEELYNNISHILHCD